MKIIRKETIKKRIIQVRTVWTKKIFDTSIDS